MDEKTTERETRSSPTWETLGSWLRPKLQMWIHLLLEEELTELLGRQKSERRATLDAPPDYRNGHGKPRRVSTPLGTLTVRQQRARGLEARFASRILPARFTGGRRRSGSCCPSSICMGSPWAISTWRCVGSWATERLCPRVRSGRLCIPGQSGKYLPDRPEHCCGWRIYQCLSR